MKLVFPIAGAVIGSFIPGVGPGLGWAIGGALGGVLFPDSGPELPTQYGPRLSDLKIQTSTYGNAVPLIYGTMRIAGNMIDGLSGITEHTHTQTVEQEGGKGGGGGSSQTQVTYSYTLDCAISICEGEIIGIRKVWANSKLIFDIGDDSGLMSVIGSTSAMTVYTGSETQLPDPLVVAAHGTLSPAYRGLAYVVFNDLALEDFGNRPPNFEFEVVASGSNQILIPNPVYDLPSSRVITNQRGVDNAAAVTDDGAYLWTVNQTGLTTNELVCTNNYTGEKQVSYVSAGHLKIAGITGGVCFFEEFPNENPAILNGIRSISVDGAITDYPQSDSYVGTDLRVTGVYVGSEQLLFEYNSPASATQYIIRWQSSSLFDDTALKYRTQNHVGSRSINAFIQRADRIAGRVYIYAYNPDNTILAYFNTGSLEESLTPTVVRTYTQAGGLGAFIGSDGYIYARSVSLGSCNMLEKMDAEGTVIDSVALPGVGVNDVLSVTRMAQDDTGKLYVQVDDAIYRVFYGTMELDANATFASSSDKILPGGAFEGKAITTIRPDLTSTVRMIAADTIATDPPLLSDIVADLCERAGLSSGEVDVSDLTSITILGYLIARRGPVRANIEPLATARFFDGIESDNKLKFVLRGSNPIVTIPEDELAAHDGAESEPPDQALINRQQEMELPVSLDISYYNPATDYQISTQSSRRLVTSAKKSTSISLPIVMNDGDAMEIADASMFSLWISRQTLEFATSRKYIKYEPTDVVSIVKNGETLNARLVSKEESISGVIKWTAVLDDSSIYTQISPGVASRVPPATTKMVGISIPAMMDIPLLRDRDDSIGFYYGARGPSPDWRGGKLFQTLGDGTYSELSNSQVLDSATFGYAESVLGDYDVDFSEQVDRYSYVDVFLPNGESLSSITNTQLYNYGNAAVLGGEVIQFQTATSLGSNLWRLRNLMRGCLGSESFIGSHAVGDLFVLLDTTLRSITIPAYQLNNEYDYKAVSIGRTLQQSGVTPFTSTGRKSKPLAPVHIGAGKILGGNILIQWVRRTRYAAAWADSIDAPLGESSEAYEVDILDENGLVLRTISATSESATYTAAQQTTDFGAVVDGVTGQVFQISSEFGRGYAGDFSFGGGSLNPHRYWRFSAMTHPAGYAALQLSELALFNGSTNLTSSPATGITITSSAASGINGTSPVNLIDGALNIANQEFWTDPAITGLTIRFDFGVGNPKIVDGVKQGYYLHDKGYLDAFTLEYSDDNVTWHPKASVSGLPGGSVDATYSPLITF